jgi:chromate reductase, NAD(P)H dehydrogenase (quinone)
VDLMPDGAQLEAGSIHGIPLYDGDLEAAQGSPPAVQALKDRILQARGLLLVTPEYNNSLPGAFKNAIDWLSRPSADIPKVFGDRPVAVIGASPGGFGTILAQNAWLPVLRTLGTRPWFGGRMQVSRAGNVFDAAGELTDEAIRAQLRNIWPASSISSAIKRPAAEIEPLCAGANMPAWAHTIIGFIP